MAGTGHSHDIVARMTSEPSTSPAIRAADLTATAVLLVGFSALVVVLGGIAAWLGLGSSPCLGDTSGRCAHAPVGPRFVAWTLVGALTILWAVAVWRIVARIRGGLTAWTVPILAAGVAVFLMAVGAVLMAVVA